MTTKSKPTPSGTAAYARAEVCAVRAGVDAPPREGPVSPLLCVLPIGPVLSIKLSAVGHFFQMAPCGSVDRPVPGMPMKQPCLCEVLVRGLSAAQVADFQMALCSSVNRAVLGMPMKPGPNQGALVYLWFCTYLPPLHPGTRTDHSQRGLKRNPEAPTTPPPSCRFPVASSSAVGFKCT